MDNISLSFLTRVRNRFQNMSSLFIVSLINIIFYKINYTIPTIWWLWRLKHISSKVIIKRINRFDIKVTNLLGRVLFALYLLEHLPSQEKLTRQRKKERDRTNYGQCFIIIMSWFEFEPGICLINKGEEWCMCSPNCKELLKTNFLI